MPRALRAWTSLFALTMLLLAPQALAKPVHFAAPVFVDGQRAGGEPLMWADHMHNTLLYTSHAGTTHLYQPGLASGGTLDFLSTYRNQVFMWRSEDAGKKWDFIDLGGGFGTNPGQNQGFSDPDFTQDAGGRIYNTGIDLANDAVFSSPDGGKTWDRGTSQCHPGDRPWLAGGKKDEVFLATNTEEAGHVVFQSTDGGNSCPLTGITANGTTADGEGWTGNGKILFDQATQTVVEPTNFGTAGVGIDTWHRGDTEFRPSKAADTTDGQFAHWPAIAIDDGGTTYLVWDDDPKSETENGGCDGAPSPLPNHILMAYTRDFGKEWSKVYTIAAPADHRVLWPWVAAGEAGRVSIVWYETDKVVDLGCQPAKFSIKQSTILNATSDRTRTIETVDAVGRPIADSDLCLSGTTCAATGEDRRLGDFFTNSVGLDGCTMIASGDTTQKDPVTGDERPTSRPIFLRQDSGPRLRGTGDCSGSTEPDILPSSRTCKAKRLTLKLRRSIRRARVKVDGKRAKVVRRKGRLRAKLVLRGKGRHVVRVTGRTRSGKKLRVKRVYRTCLKKR